MKKILIGDFKTLPKNTKALDLFYKYLYNYCDEKREFDSWLNVTKIIKENNNKNTTIILWKTGCVVRNDFFQKNIIHANIIVFTCDWWVRHPNRWKSNNGRIKKAVLLQYRANDYKIITFSTIKQLSEFHNFDYTPYSNNIICNNLWTAYDKAFINFNKNPIKKLLIHGSLYSLVYPERWKMTKFKNIDVLKRVYNKGKEGTTQNYNKNLNKYVACFYSSVYGYNLSTKKMENTHTILLKVYEILASGSLLVAASSEENSLKNIGIINNKHCILINMKSNIQQQINDILNNPNIDTIRKNGQEYAKKHFTTEAKFEELKEFL